MFEQMRTLISEQLDIDIERIKEDSSFTEDLGADSLDIVDLLSDLEDRLAIVIPQDELKDVKTVGQLCAVVEKITG